MVVVKRLTFQRQWAVGRTLNLGCGDDPADFGSSAIHVDLDRWRHPNFIQADCRWLPFANRSFRTAVLGDILEHCTDYNAVIDESVRVADRLVITVPEEHRLPSAGQHIDLGVHLKAEEYRKEYGFVSDDDYEILNMNNLRDERFLHQYSEHEIPHQAHINRFDESGIDAMVDRTGMRVLCYLLANGEPLKTWCLCLEH